MKSLRRSSRFKHLCRLLLAPVLLAGTVLHAADATPDTLYDKDPKHLWNRLSSALITRAPEGKTIPPDLLDPPHIELLFEGEANKQTISVLNEFLKGEPRPGSMTPVQRAVMQRDLLAVFHRLSGLQAQNGTQWTGPERELATALASAIRHVALTSEEIHKLPDNYAAATVDPEAVTVDDATHPAPFLPKDLLADDGPWIALDSQGSGKALVAQFHFKMLQGRTSFEVRMRHPEGRAAGEAYLKSLADMRQPWVYEKSERAIPNVRDSAPWPNPDTPQFPVGTMWALVRRAILADKKGQLVVSPLVESIQIRVYRKANVTDELNSPEFQKFVKELEETKREYELDDLLAARYMTSFEWEMQRALLLGKGGFHLTRPEDLKFSGFVPSEPRPVASFCMQCHLAPGIHSIQSRAGLFSEPLARPPEFRPSNRENLDRITTYEARTQPGWLLLQWLWEDSPDH